MRPPASSSPTTRSDSTTTTEHLLQDQMSQIHVPMASTSTGGNSPPSSYLIKHVGMDDGLEKSLLPRLNSPYVAQHQTNNAKQWPSSLKIPTWVHVPSGEIETTNLTTYLSICVCVCHWI
ncbi:hypothetical protein PPACK8108_LOCUS17113 [Phakopsora pachyrhizi]|uniref:Uncharacterized protein n=1 Tax=Phakopsora pachyrhizi TaxID=170000 RepID=A0AAV0BCF7_PHAPC|nr:hypothetical protein PPACK8108_LOCUS17113 [Phakopsora pachyrhizi]